MQAFREYQRKKEEERRIKDIRTIASKYNVYFIHGIRPDRVNPNNPGLERHTQWRNKLDILLGHDLELSTSTIREGDGAENMFSRIGVILRKGTAGDARAGDAGTIATKTGGKATYSTRMTNPQEDIGRAIFYRRDIITSGISDWNEFIVGGDIQFAGLYVCLDRRDSDRMLEMNPNEFKRRNGYDLLTQERIKEVADVAQAINIPLFAIQEGVVYEAEYGMENGQYYIRKKGEPITPAAISNSTFSLSAYEMEAARKRTSGYLKIRLRPKKEEQQTEYTVYVPSSEVLDQASEIKSTLENPNFTAENLIRAFKRNPVIKNLYESSAGVREGYSTEQHTLMVMRQFEKYFSQRLRVNRADMANLMLMYYMCDAGSYTRDAGGKQSLDSLFKFGRDTTGKPTIMEFTSDQTRRKIADLKMYLGKN